MIANRDQRYGRIAKACLAVLNTPDIHLKNKKQLIGEVYSAIEDAFSVEQNQLLLDLEKTKQVVKQIHNFAENGDATSCLQLTTSLLGQKE